MTDILLPPASEMGGLTDEQLALLAQLLDAEGIDSPSVPHIPQRATEVYPLSFAQEWLWLLDQLIPDKSVYVVPLVLRLRGDLQVRALSWALTEIVARHTALRATFTNEQGAPVQRIAPPSAVPLPMIDLGPLPPAIREQVAQGLYRTSLQRGFDLATGPLLRAELLRLDRQDHILVLLLHHIVSDEGSIRVLSQELTLLYTAAVTGQPADLPALPIQYADFAAWQREQLHGAVLDQQIAYWRQHLAGLPILALPTDHPRPAVQTYRGAYHFFALPAPPYGAITALGREEGATPFMVLLAVFQALLARYSGLEDIAVGAPITNRTYVETENLIGCFLNTLVFRTQVSADLSFRDLLRSARTVVIDAFAHQDVPFEQLVEALQPVRHPGINPLFQVMFGLEDASAASLELQGIVWSPIPLAGGTTKLDLTLSLETAPSGLTGVIEYSTDLYDAVTIARMADHFALLLAGLIAKPDLPVWQHPILTPNELRLFHSLNETDTVFPYEWSIQRLLTQQAARTPDAIAVRAGEQQLTYADLERRSNQLAHMLQRLGVGPEVMVGIGMERSPDLIIALVGVLKAGGVYVPLDPSYPPERLAFMLNNTGMPVLLTRKEMSGLDLSLISNLQSLRILCLDHDWAMIAKMPETNPNSSVAPDNLAYVIYTSGSTGQPKGVMVEQQGLLNHLFAMIQDLQLTGADRLAQTASQSFDISVWQFLTPLLIGAEVQIFPDAIAHNPQALLSAIKDQHTTILELVPTMISALEEELAQAPDSETLAVRWLLATGEALPVELARRWYARCPHIPLMNAYGPSECSDDVSLYVVSPEGAVQERQMSIGRPIANMQLYVLDHFLNLVPIGVPGELCVGGVGVGRGYLGNPVRTARAFVPDPFSASPGARLYRTGDLACYQPDGAIVFLGRIDHQVKLRGFRIELGEIEAVLLQHPGVNAAVVLLREDALGEAQLVAYVVANPALELAEVRQFLQLQLPAYMLPTALVCLDAFPLTPNGKIDRKALPMPGSAQSVASGQVAPRTPLEALLADMWCAVLGRASIGVQDNFFALGGHSLRATQLVARVRSVLEVELPVQAVFEAPTIAEMALLVQARQGDTVALLPPLLPQPRPDRLPLSFAQERLWFLDQLQPDSTAYNVPLPLRLSGPLEHRALLAALRHLLARHESLRTTFLVQDGRPEQVIATAAEAFLPLRTVDLRGWPQEQQAALVRQLATEEVLRSFDLARGPLLRVVLLLLDDQEHALVLTLHHIIVDGWSMDILLRDLMELYNAEVSGQPAALPTLPIQYADYALWQREWLDEAVLAPQLDYWTSQLTGLAPLTLPTDHPRPTLQSSRGGAMPVVLGAEETAALRALGQREGCTLFMVLLAAYQVLLHRYSGQNDIAVGTPIAGRNQAATEELVGFLVNTLVLRTDLGGTPSFREVLRRVRKVALEAYAHQEVPFERVVEAVQPVRDLSRSPLFQVMLVHQNVQGLGNQWGAGAGALTVRGLEVTGREATFDLTLTLEEGERGIPGELEYNADLYEPATIARLWGHLQVLLAAVLDDIEQPISTLPLLTQAEYTQILHEWNAACIPLPEGYVHTLIAEHADRMPDAVAVVSETEHLTYAALNQQVNRLAHRLRRLGVEPDTCVAVLMERTPDLIVALLGVLKAGGFYLPLDPTYPPARLAFMLADTQAPVLITHRELPSTLGLPAPATIYLDNAAQELASEPSSEPASLTTPDHLAYVIYTSGSTGQPKGVTVIHRALVNYVAQAREAYRLRAGERLLQFASISFDISVEDIFTTLVGGATLVLRSEQMLDSVELFLETCRRWNITVLNFPTSYWHEITVRLESEDLALPPLVSLVIVGGEQVIAERLAAWHRRVGQRVRLMNGYGPTEATVAMTYRELTQMGGKADLHEVPIGRPIANVQVYLLDAALQPVPVGVPGELYIGGTGLARGYLDRPDLTAERFVPDPFARTEDRRLKIEDSSAEVSRELSSILYPLSSRGERLYRTGDLARYQPDGAIVFLGRIDHQVKLRGFRIELGEIEALLHQHPAVAAAVVLLRKDALGESQLVAYVVATPVLELAEVRQFLEPHLPAYMLPTALVCLDALPLTPNGKIDRKALPMPSSVQVVTSGQVAPRTPLEGLLLDIWRTVLGRTSIGVQDNFFALGGHSLRATQLVARVRSVLEVELPVRVVFEAPTIAEMALLVQAQQSGALTLPPPLVPQPRQGRLPLSFAQERLWFLDQLQPDSSAYNVPLPLRLSGPLEHRALLAALRHLLARHESLRTTFLVQDGRPEQVIAPATEALLPLRTVDLRGWPQEQQVALVRQLATEEVHGPFDLARGPLMRVVLLLLDAQEHALVLTLHHTIVDGWSVDVLLRDLVELYNAEVSGRPAVLPTLPIQYADYALWQRAWLDEAVLAPQLAFWTSQLGGLEPLMLPTDHPRPAVQTNRGGALSLQFDVEETQALRALSQREGCTLFMVLLVAYQVLLHRYSGQNDIAVGTPIAGRSQAATEELVGLFVNTLVLRTDLGGRPSFREVLRRVRKVALEAYAHQEVPFERVVDAVQPVRDLSRSPLFQVMLVHQNVQGLGNQWGVGEGTLTVRGLEVTEQVAAFDLTLTLQEYEQGIACELEYNADLYEPATIARLWGHLQVLLAAVLDDIEQPISMLPLLTQAEYTQLLLDWNATHAPIPEGCVHTLIAEYAARMPDALAVVSETEHLTYAALDRQANRLAHRLRRVGVGPDVFVAIHMQRTPDLIVALLGVLKAGGAYVPLDPTYPPARLAFMLADTQAPVLITQRALPIPPEFPPLTTIYLDNAEQELADEPPTTPVDLALPDHLAYVIYTSGSTGQPKGVTVIHRALVNYVAQAREAYRLRAGERLLQFASISFDISVEDIFTTLVGGATLVLRSEQMLDSVELFLETCRRWNITVLNFPTSYWHEITVRLESEDLALPPLVSLVIVGGEQVIAERLAAWHRRVGQRVRLMNGYGPTEATVAMTYRELTQMGGKADLHEVPIGRPIANVQVYLLDAALQPVPVGVPGELYIGGTGLARGYLDRPDLTAERFVPDPFARTEDRRLKIEDSSAEVSRELSSILYPLSSRGERLYRTGDLARYQPDGAIVFLGRIDHQVKLRGFRIELGEIEALLHQHPAVAAAVVLLRADALGESQLVAYVVATPVLELAEVRQFLEPHLPAYMLPTALVCLASLPYTSSGKIDRKALPAPTIATLAHAPAHLAPRTLLEGLLLDIWRAILGHSNLGIHDNFFALGGHSLRATQLVARVRSVLEVELPVRVVFEAPTIAEMALLVQAQQSGALTLPPPLVPQPRQGRLPLSFAQERLWFLDQLQPDSSTYNVPLPLRLSGPLEHRALLAALRHLLARHESLRTTFLVQDGRPEQVIAPATEVFVPLRTVDLRGWPQEQQAVLVRQLATEEVHGPFDLARGPLIRVVLLLLDAQEHALVLTLHHTIVDGWSVDVLLRDLVELYNAEVSGRPASLPTLPIQYADYALWQREWLSEAVLAPQLAFWTSQLAGLAPLALPTDHPRPAVQTNRGGSLPVALDVEQTAALRALGQREGCTLFMVLLAAYQVLLHRYSGQADIAVGTPVAGRSQAATEELVGLFVNTLVLHTGLGGEPSFREVLRRVRKVALEAYAHQEVPFERVVEAVQPVRDLSRSPLFQVMLVYQPAHRLAGGKGMAGGNLELRGLEVTEQVANFELTLTLEEYEQGIAGELEYNADLYEPATIARLWGHLQVLLAAVLDDVEQPISTLPLLTQAEYTQLLHDWNDTLVAYPEQTYLHQMVAGQAVRTPDALAVRYGTVELTYQALDRQANQLAHYLRARGVGPDVTVGLCMGRSLEQIIGLLGILKVGGAYVPLDPEYPAERLAYMLADSQAKVLITNKEIRDWRPALSGVEGLEISDSSQSLISNLQSPIRINLDDMWEQIAREPDTAPQSGVASDNLAYVIYTSGSTGQPKGVAVAHRSVINLAAALRTTLGDEFGVVQRRVSVNGPLTFDTSVKQIIQLLGGHTLDIVPFEVRFDADALAGYLQQHAIDVFDCTPSQLRLLTADGRLAGLRPGPAWVLVGGEPIDAELWQTLAADTGRHFFNLYGPTECTVDTTTARLETARTPTIGRPLANVQVYVLDTHMQPVPVGVPGELYIGGAGLARGYLHRPDLTAEKFVPNPFASTTDDRRPTTDFFDKVTRRQADKVIEVAQEVTVSPLHRVSVPGETVVSGQWSVVSDRLYRTGDLVCYRPDGTLVFLGRIDHQIKLRGFRIELGEIEALLYQHPNVTAAAVLLRSDGLGEPQLVAYLAASTPVELAEVRQFLQPHLPAYMLPTALVCLDALPLNFNGKIDRKALPAPTTVALAPAPGVLNPLEALLLDIWRAVLGLNAIGIHDNFFELGGHSLRATQLVARVRSVLEVELPVRVVFEAPTIAEMALLVQAQQSGGLTLPPPLVPQPRLGRLPLSFAQERLWFLDQLQPDSSTYNVPLPLRLSGPLEHRALLAALRHLLARHESLRTTFLVQDGRPEQVIVPATEVFVPLRTVDLRGWPQEQQAILVRQLATEEVHGPFDLARGPLMRVVLLLLDTQEHALVLTLHHTIVDGWSVDVLLRDLVELYNAEVSGRPASLPTLPIQYADYALWQREWLSEAVLAPQLAFWTSQLAGLAPLALPTDHPRPAVQTNRGGSLPVALDVEQTAALRALGQREGCTLFMVLLAAYQVVLHRYSGQNDIAVGTPVAGRSQAATEELVGLFVNTLVLHTGLGGEPSFREVLRRVRKVALEAYAHQEVPFERVVEAVQPVRDLSRSPLFQVMLVYQPAHRLGGGRGMADGALTLRGLEVTGRLATFELTLTLEEYEQGIAGELEYNADLYEPATIARLWGHLQVLLAAVLDDIEQPINTLPLLTQAEYTQLLHDWNDTLVAYPEQTYLHQMVAGQAVRTPDALAVRYGTVELTYQALDRQANRLAHYLRRHGVGAEARVGVCLERSPELVVALLGVLKAGGAYVPLDPTYPSERLAYMLEDARATVLLTGSGDKVTRRQGDTVMGSEDIVTLSPLHHVSVSGLSVVDLNHDWEMIAREPETCPAVALAPDNLAYVIYTSGSTGRPKGVMIVHSGLANYLNWAVEAYAVAQGNGAPVHSSISFDLTVTSLFAPLVSGGTVVLIPESQGVEGLAAALSGEEAFSLAKITPAHLGVLGQLIPPARAATGARALVIGGEALLYESLAFWRAHAPQARLINEYGPTETVVGCCVYEAPATDSIQSGAVPIGRPIANTQLYILNQYLQPVPIGVPGELYIGGAQLARGYLGQPALTAERFVPNPFATTTDDRRPTTDDREPRTENQEPRTSIGIGSPAHPLTRSPVHDGGQWSVVGGRLYRTGDLARYLPNGDIEYLGRIDQQVKLRGFRIELGEIEALLHQHPAIAAAAVLLLPDEQGDSQLVAYLVAAPALELAEVRQFLQPYLPAYMLPTALVGLEALPHTPNGKIDRQALMELDISQLRPRQTLAAPQDMLELQLVQIWETVLKISPIGIHDNFFELGGHSLLAVRLMAQITRQLGVTLPLTTLFRQGTIAQLARVVRSQDYTLQRRLIALKPAGTHPPFFCVHPAGGEVLCYFDLARLLAADQPFYALQAAGLYGEEAPDLSIEQMAARYVAAIQEQQPAGPYFLGGWSLGGVVAFEMAQQLRQQGQTVALLGLLDTPVPDAIDAEPLERPLTFAEEQLDRLISFAQHLGVEVEFLPALAEQIEPHAPDKRLASALAHLQRTGTLSEDITLQELQHRFQVFEANVQALGSYVPRPYDGDLWLFNARKSPEDATGTSLGWDTLARSVTLYEVPGTHFTMVRQPHVAALAALLQLCLAAAHDDEPAPKP